MDKTQAAACARYVTARAILLGRAQGIPVGNAAAGVGLPRDFGEMEMAVIAQQIRDGWDCGPRQWHPETDAPPAGEWVRIEDADHLIEVLDQRAKAEADRLSQELLRELIHRLPER